MKSNFYSIQLSLYSDEKYQALSSPARFTLHALKAILPHSNIDRVIGLVENIQDITGLTEGEILAALNELEVTRFCV